MNIALVQSDNHWEDVEKNLSSMDVQLKAVDDEADLIVLPEMFTTGFTMAGQRLAETMEGSSVQWMKSWAEKKQCLLMGSMLIQEQGRCYNRCLAVFPDGTVKHYDKRHLFTFAGEDEAFSAGSERLVFAYKGFRICPLICYDLRFPVWSRNTADIDLLIYMANWPDARMSAWDTLLKARAIENMCYVAAVNRVGQDANDLNYVGHSSAFDAMGERLAMSEGAKQEIVRERVKDSLNDIILQHI